ncbi:FAD-dependent oxidoreductase [Oleispirillum naphthae]|uniref:oxidoreductase n=1 Tax=Oleispirillum naphthae TaxID=2838853 RepID=UPI003082243C
MTDLPTAAASAAGSPAYPLLAQAGRIGRMRLKNRIVMGPMGTNYGTTDGFPTDRDKRYYAERARGGTAMIITEAMNISSGARNHNNSLCIYHDCFIPGLAEIVDAIKDNGALAVAQLNHRGQLLRRSVLGMEPVGPSAGAHPFTGEPVRALAVPEIRDIQRLFTDAARRIWRAGYDACEIHAANGYLFQQFFSERFNKRTDEYGGSLENRMRLLRETVEMIGDAVPDLQLMVRISASEFTEGGYTMEEAIALAETLERAGIVALDLSGGSNEHPSLSRYCIQPPSFPRGCLAPYAKPFKDALGIPVIMAGRIITPEDAESVLASESTDFVSLGRALIADPHWVGKALGEVKAPIRRCISCNVCFERLTLELDVSCAANPMVGTEFEALEFLEPQLFAGALPTDERKNVLVLGAGVSGAETARIAGGLGHRVEIWEQSDVAGGQLPLTTAAPDKEDVNGIWIYRKESLAALGIPIRTGVAVSAQALRRAAPDLIVVATGAKPRPLPVKMDFAPPVLQSWQVLHHPERLKEKAHVTIIGGGMVGVETADLLVTRGCTVTIIEMRTALAPELARNNRFEIVQRLEAAGVRIITGARMQRTEGNGVVLSIDGAETTVDLGDAVILAVGSQPNRDSLQAVEDSGIPYVLVGDCNKPGDYRTAVRDASMTALSINHMPRKKRHEPLHASG